MFSTTNCHLYHYAGNNPVVYNDPDGRCPQIVIGGLIGGGCNALKATCEGKSGREIAGAFVGGFVFGAMVVATGGLSLGAQITAGAMAGAASYFAECGVSGEIATPEGALEATVSGSTAVMSGILLDKAAGQVTKVLSNFGKAKTITKNINGVTVIQDNSIINPNLVDSRGRTNIERMKKGLAPIGPDGKSINLHHVDQTMEGPVQEMTASYHQQNYSSLHFNTGESQSQIDRDVFDVWRRNYWKQRANDF